MFWYSTRKLYSYQCW